MKEKILIFLTCIFIAMSISGFTYAQWNDTIVVRNTMTLGQWNDTLNMGFVYPLNCTEYHTNPYTGKLLPGEYLDKDVGKCECQYKDLVTDLGTGISANKTLNITITNAYPSYEVHCNFTVQNIGQLPLHINETVISDPSATLTWNSTLSALVDADDKPVIDITITPDLVCNNLSSEAKMWFELVIHITQNAEECHQYTLQVKIMYEEAP